MNLKASVIRASDFLDERINPVSHHLFHAVIFSGLLFFAAFSSVELGKVTVLGHAVPSLCMFHRITGFDCPGCGLTRSFVLALHGQWHNSYLMHLWGIPLVAIVAFQIPYRFWRAAGGPPFQFHPRLGRWFRVFVIFSVLLPWAFKTIWNLVLILV